MFLSGVGGVLTYGNIMVFQGLSQDTKKFFAPEEPEISSSLPIPKLESPKAYTCQEILASSLFYRAESLQAFKLEADLRNKGKEEIANKMQTISCVPQGIWVNGQNPASQAQRVRQDVEKAREQGKTPLFVIYDGPEHTRPVWRHVATGKPYEDWISTFAKAVGESPAWIIFEPDAIPMAFNFSQQDRASRMAEIKKAVQILKTESPNVKVYLDAGHGQWKSPEIIVDFLQQAGIELADGFSLNVSNHQPLADELTYGKTVSDMLGGVHFVVDIGQSGKKVEGQEWCNPSGRALGGLPTMDTGSTIVDALLWIKPPGESDGTCNGGPPAGKFWLDYALQIIENSPSAF